MKLTPDQQAAAHAPGSVAVTAGAGTGKTAMLAERYLHHIQTDGLSPLQIVAVTFTDMAADELRARIRKQVAGRVADPEVSAEVDASQISTIHALAARICRDFYHLAGIPADFRILDDTDGQMWSAAQLDTAVEILPIEIREAVSYSRLRQAIKKFLDDPMTAEKALQVTPETWRAAIATARQRAIDIFVAGDALRDGCDVLQRFNGEGSDLLEIARRGALLAAADLREGTRVVESITALKSLKINVGRKGSWPNGGIDEVKAAFVAIRKEAETCLKFATLEYNAGDEELGRLIGLLARAFSEVKGHIDREKREARLLDYNDLEINALRILEDPDVRAHYRERWKAVMVDEFQDTNAVQAEIIRRVSEDAKITVVGDEKQSIYGFRGADVEVFGEFRREIVDSGKGSSESLSQSFRTHSALVETTNRIFGPILGPLHQPLDAFRTTSGMNGPHVELRSVEKLKDTSSDGRMNVEASDIADEIARLVSSKTQVYDKHSGGHRDIRYRDIAVLSRAWAPLDTYADTLAASGIPVVHAGGGSLLETREAKDVFALIGFLANPLDDINLLAVLRSPFFAVSDRDLFEFARSTKRGKEEHWWTAMKREPGALLRPLTVLSELVDARDGLTAQELVRRADGLTAYSAVIANLPHGPRREADWTGIMALLDDFEQKGRHDPFSVSRFVRQLLEFEVDIPRPRLDGGDAVQLMTVHGAKGLEWPVVFIPALTRRNNSDSDGIKIDPELGVAFRTVFVEGQEIEPAIYKVISLAAAEREAEEGKRVLYVALTRAQEKIYLSSASDKDEMDLEVLRPGLENAADSVKTKTVAYEDTLAIPATPQPPPAFAVPRSMQPSAVPMGLSELAVTGLSDYLKCPRQFRYRHVDGHPGIREGRGEATIIGVLAHRALEMDVTDAAALKTTEPRATAQDVEEALALAMNFKTKRAYESVRGSASNREVALELDRHGLSLIGTADLVASDFVLDYKTDMHPEPAEHGLQLWAYARALGKPTAHIAYLRHDLLHTFTGRDLDAMDELADSTIKGIVQGRFDAKPSVAACTFCAFAPICPDRADPE